MTSSAQCVAYRFGSFILDLERGSLLAQNGKDLPLRPQSFALLLLLVKNAGRLLSQKVIMDELWPDVFVTENNITQCIHDIRAALGSGSFQIVRTCPRRGYVFALDVTAVPACSLSKDAADHCDSAVPMLTHSLTGDHKNEYTDAETTGARSQRVPASVSPQRARKRLSPGPSVRQMRSAGVKSRRYWLEDIPETLSADLVQYLVRVVLDALEMLRHQADAVNPRRTSRTGGAPRVAIATAEDRWPASGERSAD